MAFPIAAIAASKPAIMSALGSSAAGSSAISPFMQMMLMQGMSGAGKMGSQLMQPPQQPQMPPPPQMPLPLGGNPNRRPPMFLPMAGVQGGGISPEQLRGLFPFLPQGLRPF